MTTGGDGDNPSTRGASERSLFKVESGINGLLPLDKLGVPSIYSVSRLSRLRSALGRLLSFALIALSSFLATVSQPRKSRGYLAREANRGVDLHFGWTVDSIRRMTPEELFTAALGLGRQWRVAECRFEGEPKRLELRLEHVPGEHFQCPVCKASCGVHDTIERRWRHMNFFQYRCELVARVPRTWCRTDGVHQVPVPWAREGSGFTLMMEALVMLLSAEMPVDAMADLIDEHDTRLWRVLMHYVEQAHAKSDWSAVRRIAVDETSARRGRHYVTNVLDDENSRLLLMVEGRGVQALGAFAEALRLHGGDPSQLILIGLVLGVLDFVELLRFFKTSLSDLGQAGGIQLADRIQ